VAGYSRLEVSVGLFVAGGLIALGFLSLSVAGLRLWGGTRYELHARFAHVGALRPGAAVSIAGVPVGRVRALRLTDNVADTALEIDPSVRIPADSIASIRTLGLLGETYIAIEPGGDDHALTPGARVRQTEPAVDVVDLLGRYAFGKHDEDLQ
jgi:phospholipid/cholesterol/gamma-HCH transport system substrate-binding protein